LWMEYNPSLCAFKSLLVIWDSSIFTITYNLLCVLCIMLVFAFMCCENIGLVFIRGEWPFCVWTSCTIQGIFILCFICAGTMIIVGVNIWMHDKFFIGLYFLNKNVAHVEHIWHTYKYHWYKNVTIIH